MGSSTDVRAANPQALLPQTAGTNDVLAPGHAGGERNSIQLSTPAFWEQDGASGPATRHQARNRRLSVAALRAPARVLPLEPPQAEESVMFG